MHPVLFEISGHPVGTYGVCALLGALAGWALARLLAGKNLKIGYAALMCLCGAFLGAFLLRPITRIPEVIINREQFQGQPPGAAMGYLFGEMVFYGGLIGGAIALCIYCKMMKISPLPLAAVFAPAVALGHAFGRVGCFFGGCCYGVPVSARHPFAVSYPTGIAPHGEPLLAVPLIEAACLLIIAAVLCVVYKKAPAKHRDTLTLCLYGTLYPILRFVLEFYRGDPVRGIYGPFSTSQYISIAIFCASLLLLRRGYRYKMRSNYASENDIPSEANNKANNTTNNLDTHS